MNNDAIVIAMMNIKDYLPVSDEGLLYDKMINEVITHYTPIAPRDIHTYREHVFSTQHILAGSCPYCRGYVTEKDRCCRQCGQLLDWTKAIKEER